MVKTEGIIFYGGRFYDKSSRDGIVDLFDRFLDDSGSREEFYRVFREMTGITAEEYIISTYEPSNVVNEITWTVAVDSYGYSGEKELSSLNHEWMVLLRGEYLGPEMVPVKGYGGNRGSSFVPYQLGEL